MDALVLLAAHQIGFGFDRMLFSRLDEKYAKLKSLRMKRRDERNHFEEQLATLRCF